MRLSMFVALLSWVSFFLLTWWMLLGDIAANFMFWFFWVVFLLIALFASSIHADHR